MNIFTIDRITAKYVDLLDLSDNQLIAGIGVDRVLSDDVVDTSLSRTSFVGDGNGNNDDSPSENIILTRNSNNFNKIRNLNQPSFRNNRIVFASVIVTSFLLLVFLICIAIVRVEILFIYSTCRKPSSNVRPSVQN
jgi:hypothetical protein